MKELEIENGILTACNNEIESITIPKEVKSIKPFALGYNLCEILVDKENEHFTSVDGVLYTKDMKALVQYPEKKSGKIYTLPFSVEKIYDYALSAKELEYIEVDDENKHFKSIDGVLYSADTKVLVAYPWNRAGEEYSLCEGCETIKRVNSQYIKRLILPASIKNVDGDKLGAFYKLSEIKVHKSNKYFTSVDGVLYTKNMKALVKYPRRKAGRLYEIPSSVTQIGKYAFSFCEHLVSVKMPDSLNKISEDAFSNMWSLKKIKIPKGVKRIPESCFLFCNKLRKVVFHNKIERICPAAFMGCEKLKKIKLPESLVKIEAIAFLFTGLKKVKLSGGVKAVGAFDVSVAIKQTKRGIK